MWFERDANRCVGGTSVSRRVGNEVAAIDRNRPSGSVNRPYLILQLALQLLGMNFRLRWRHDSSLCRRIIAERFNRPLPATMAASHVDGPGSTAAFPDFPSPVIAVGRNCEHVGERGRDNHSTQHSN